MFNNLVRKAISITRESKNETRYKHVAFILRNKKTMCVGVNKRKSHPAIHRHPYKHHCANIHAELDAVIRHGKTDCSDNTLVVMRVKKDGSLGNSKPCIGCQHVLDQVGFKSVYYSTENGAFAQL